MRHQKAGRKFGRKSSARHALFSNMVSSLIEHERIRTTDAKAKELRRIAERTFSWASSVGNLVGNEKADAADKARVLHAIRMAQRVVPHRDSLHKLFNVLGPRFAARPGGFTRIMKLGHRHGDAAPMSIIELVDREEEQAEEAAPEGEKKAKKAAAPKAEAGAADKPKRATKKKAAADDEGAEKPKKARKKQDEAAE
jgi:large subunit ribosomal protein L17